MKKLAILLDSFSGFSKKELSKLGIYMVSQTVIIDGHPYKEGQDLSSTEIAKLVNEAKEIKSSMPAIGIVSETLKELSGSHENVIYITMNKGMSSTYSTGVAAAAEFKNVTVINGGTLISSMFTETAKIAYKLSDDGKPLSEIIEKIERITTDSKTFIVVKDTEKLLRSGRIGTTKKLIMEKVKLVPRLQITKDALKSAGTKRNFHKTFKSTIDKILEMIGIKNKDKYSFHIGSTGSDETDNGLKEVLDSYNITDVSIRIVGAATLGHTGMGSYGIGAMLKK